MTLTRRAALVTSLGLLAGARASGRPPADALGIAIVGCGTRGTELALEVARLGHRVVALCDVASFRLEALDAALPPDPDRFQTDELRRVLDRKSVDGVVVATPDHHHRSQLLATLAADKDVYLETPVTKSLEEHADVADAARKSSAVVQVGLQRRSSAVWEEALRLTRGRDFGKLTRATAWDNRNFQRRNPMTPPAGFKADAKTLNWEAFLGGAPKRSPDAHRYWAWRTYWDYVGGLLSEWNLAAADLISWSGSADVPKSVAVNGARYHFDAWETPDTLDAAWDYGKFAAGTSLESANASHGRGLRLHGTAQTLVADDREVRLYDTADRLTPEVQPVRTWKVESETTRHVKNWLDCMKSREGPNAPMVLGLRAAVAAHLATLSYRTGRKQFWDAERNEVLGVW